MGRDWGEETGRTGLQIDRSQFNEPNSCSSYLEKHKGPS